MYRSYDVTSSMAPTTTAAMTVVVVVVKIVQGMTVTEMTVTTVTIVTIGTARRGLRTVVIGPGRLPAAQKRIVALGRLHPEGNMMRGDLQQGTMIGGGAMMTVGALIIIMIVVGTMTSAGTTAAATTRKNASRTELQGTRMGMADGVKRTERCLDGSGLGTRKIGRSDDAWPMPISCFPSAIPCYFSSVLSLCCFPKPPR